MNLITREELRTKLERGDEFTLVMTLSAFAYETKHIPASRHFERCAEAVEALDPAEEIVVYCADVYCAASIYAYRHLERAGFTRLRRYAGGVVDWEEAGYRLETGLPERQLQPSAERSQRERVRGPKPRAAAMSAWRVSA